MKLLLIIASVLILSGCSSTYVDFKAINITDDICFENGISSYEYDVKRSSRSVKITCHDVGLPKSKIDIMIESSGVILKDLKTDKNVLDF